MAPLLLDVFLKVQSTLFPDDYSQLTRRVYAYLIQMQSYACPYLRVY